MISYFIFDSPVELVSQAVSKFGLKDVLYLIYLNMWSKFLVILYIHDICYASKILNVAQFADEINIFFSVNGKQTQCKTICNELD